MNLSVTAATILGGDKNVNCSNGDKRLKNGHVSNFSKNELTLGMKRKERKEWKKGEPILPFLPLLPFLPAKSVKRFLKHARSEVVRGFWLKVDWLWQKPLPSVLDALEEMGVL